MCTVSYFCKDNKVIITSNRDEDINRQESDFPKCHFVSNKKLYFPKDPKAGGTWFVVNEIGHVFVLLNGADFKHKSNPPYRESRGQIVLKIAASNDCINQWNEISLDRIENFTMIVFNKKNLFKLQWNGEVKSMSTLDNNKPYIWSSATLYDNDIVVEREKWFSDFLKIKQASIGSEDIIDFHSKTKHEDSVNGLIINRGNKMLTKSITQAIITGNRFKIKHWDLVKNETMHLNSEINK